MTERVLLIDDDEVFVRVLARALGARGFTVATAGNRITALAAARESRPDYAVLDLKLGEENGLALIPELLELQPELRILLLTGYASIATAVEATVMFIVALPEPGAPIEAGLKETVTPVG